jgi:chaperone modulatory protein CbpM
MRIEGVMAAFPELEVVELQSWVARGWIRPDGEIFTEIDIARIRLVRDLRHDMAIAEDTMALVLSLIDQLSDLRQALRSVRVALEAQPEAIREPVLRALRR